VPKQLPDRWRDLGSFIREQRSTSRLSLRRLSELAGISNPYLSQIERGLRRPSAEILQQIAKALRISAETLYVQAGILEPGTGETDLGREILAATDLNEEQKQALIRIYLSFRHENDARSDLVPPGEDDPGPDGPASRPAPSGGAGVDEGEADGTTVDGTEKPRPGGRGHSGVTGAGSPRGTAAGV
jgi:transcriptional regulator with XRE-family HTH domain